MEWKDHALVLGVRNHGETSAIVELMTREHGRHLGLVRGGRSRKMRPVLQSGNLIHVTWRARLDEHLGYYLIEPDKLRAASLMTARSSLFTIQILAAHLRLLAERDAHAPMYEAANIVLDHAHDPLICARLIIRFELALLEELGFGLNLTQCVVSGTKQDLKWVSPKSGCAVCEKEGQPWAASLLTLPHFMPGRESSDVLVSTEELISGFTLTGHFLERNVYIPRAIRAPDERVKFIDDLGKQNQ
ncbi:MAG: DNA repair protein RecO [Rhizobiaceae bacterium]|nr:DNA repair protein RecO [Rhizobiaceae bacterium]